jgi:predicted AAA+ superfamily ATPase
VGLTSLSNASFLQGKYPTERLSTIESSPTNNRLLLYGSKVRGQGRSSDVKQLKASTYENAKIKSIEILASYAASRVSMVSKFLDPL